MPYGENTTGNLGSPNLISNLGNYCFQNKPKFRTEPSVANYNWRSHGNSSTSPLIVNTTERATTPPHLVIDIEIPETPESQLNKNYISRSPAVNRRASATGSSQESPIVLQKTSKRSRSALGSDTSMDSPDIVYEGCTDTNTDEYEVFCDKERCLRNLLASCPMADIMEAQDILVGCKWDLTKAIEKANTLPPKVKKKSVPAVPSKGAAYCDDISTSVPKPSVDEVVLLSDDDEEDYGASFGLTVSGVKNSSINSNGISSASNMSPMTPSITSTFGGDATKKRRRIQCLDDDSDEDPLPSSGFYSNSGTPSKKANHSSEYSVLDFKPNTSSSDLRLPVKNFTYSKTTPTQNHKYRRSVDSSVFTNDFNDYAAVVKPKPQRRNLPKPKKQKNFPSKKHESFSSKKHRKKLDTADDEDADEDYGNDEVYNSEDDSDVDENLTPARNKVLKFFQNSAEEELSTVPGCSKKKAEVLVKYRPFANWADLVKKLDSDKCLSTELLNGAKKVLDMRLAVTRLMNKCKKIALQMEDLVEALKENKEDSKDYVSKQPELLNPEMHLTSYQMLGLNWLLLMHNQEVNGILADEMGLGKTIQAISFLAYLKMQDTPGPHLIVVPSSTLDNWQNELSRWWPSASLLCYHGTQESRRELRMQIINDEVEDFDVMVATYNMVTSSPEDRAFFKKLEFHYVIFDEAHMLKNMASQRYQNLMRVKASRRLLLTGTPLQNNLVELMSLLIFAMPHMFSGKTEQIKLMFSAVCKRDENKSQFEKERIEHAKRIMKPFVLRRLKSEVLKDLPAKHEEIRHCTMSDLQAELYVKTVQTLSEQMKKDKEKQVPTSGISMMMQLRKAANHPLLMRSHFTDDKLIKMSQLMLKEPTHCDANSNFIFDDMSLMSDFELHRMCKLYKSVKSYCLPEEEILNSGKFAYLNEMMPNLIQQGHRMLLFSQFVIVLDIIQEFMRIKGYQFLRLDGQVPVYDRQTLIDEFNQNPDIPVFLISTRAGGLGINLTSADTVIIHDIDFNPYNDKQAEDRCHRVGQTKDVTVIRLVSKDTIEEGILKRAEDKLKLEKDVTSIENDEESDSTSVVTLLRDALGMSTGKS